eukprot:2748130-Amphidinium_carterae.1
MSCSFCASQDLLYIARNFDYPEDLATSAKILQQMRDDVSNVRSLWDHEVGRMQDESLSLMLPIVVQANPKPVTYQ